MTPTSPSPIKKKRAYLYAVGRRKTASARVRFMTTSEQPNGTILINEKPANQYFSEDVALIVSEPIQLIAQDLGGYFTVKVSGGGIHSQAEAIRHGIARILLQINEDWKTVLKPKGYITRDSRVKERKKPGLRRARRAPQWSKR